METFVNKVKRKTEKNKSTFTANLNAPCPTTRIPQLPILNDLLSGKKKIVRVLGTEGVKKVTHFTQSVGKPRPGSAGWLLESRKEKCGRESLDFAERPTGFAKTKC